MADNKLNYQQARQVRKSNFSNILLDQLAQKDTGVLGAIGKTISLKTESRIKGIKEKFDPLSIVKFMTMGSRFGPALFGKMTGRSQKDIDYFTGRTRSVVGSRNTADKLKKLSGGGDSQGINEQLSKIFSFLKSTREDDIRLKQISKNFDEEIAMEKEKRHKEMIKTLEKLMKQINGGGTVTSVKDTSLLDSILSSLRNMMNQVKELFDALGGLNTARKVLPWLSRLALNPITLIPILIAGGIWYALDEFKKIEAEQKIAAEKGDVATLREKIQSQLGGEGNLYANQDEIVKNALVRAGTPEALAALKKMEEGERPKTDADKYDQYLADKGYYKSMGYKNLKGEIAPEPLKKEAAIFAYGSETAVPPAPTVVPVTPPQAPVGMEFDAEGGVITSPVPKKMEPVPPAPSSAPVSNLTNTNVDLNLTSTNSSVVNKDPIVNNTTNVSNSQQGNPLRPSEISIRNDELTFMRLIRDSTVLV